MAQRDLFWAENQFFHGNNSYFSPTGRLLPYASWPFLPLDPSQHLFSFSSYNHLSAGWIKKRLLINSLSWWLRWGSRLTKFNLKTKDQHHIYVMVNEVGSKPRLAEE